MPRINRFIVPLLLVVLVLSACQPIQAPAEQIPASAAAPTVLAAPAGQPVHAPRMELQQFDFASQALAGNLVGDPATRTIFVLLPPDYATSTRRYPVLYVLPWGTSESALTVPDFRIATESLLKKGKIPGLILVFPDGANKFGASLFGSSPVIGDYESYLVHELVNYVDANYRTLPARESRALAGCSNGGDPTMRLALKYPEVFSVAAPSGGVYDEALESNAFLLKELETLSKLPETITEVSNLSASSPYPLTAWFIEAAAARVPNADNPPLLLDMPFRIINGHAEIVPEVAARIAEQDSAHEARRYVEQPLRLRGILIQHGLLDRYNPTEQVRAFDSLLTSLGIEHEYQEIDGGHCANRWEEITLEFVANHLLFEEP